jgi:trigger factor
MLETNVKSPKPWLREIEVELEPERLTGRVEETLANYRERAEVPGFRKGKVPLELLRRRIGEALESQVAEELVEQTSAEVLEAQEFRLAAQPRLADLEVLPTKAIRYRLEVEVFPEFELKAYKGLQLRRNEPTGFEQEFEKRLKALQDRCATFKPTDEPARAGLFVTVDYETLDGDKPVAEPRKNVMLEVGDPMNFPEVNEGLAGAKPGEERSIEAEMPAGASDKSLAGKKVVFRFRVNEVKEKHVPEVNEEFASDLGYDDLDGLRKDLNEAILADRQRLVENDLKNQIFDKLLRDHEFEPPGSWVQMNLDRLRREYELPDDAETTEKLTQAATRRARFDVLASRIAREEEIAVTDEEVQAQVAAMAERVRKPVEDVAPLLDNPGFRSQLLRDKVMDFILGKAEVVGAVGEKKAKDE